VWVSLGLITPLPDKWSNTLAVTNIPLIRVSWLKGNVSLNQINNRFLIRRKFISGEVEQARIIYASDEPLIIHYDDLNQPFLVQIKKLFRYYRYPRLISESFYQIQIDYLP